MMTTPRPERGAGICACAFIGEPWLTFGCATCGLRGAWPARRKCAVLHALWPRRLHASRHHRLHAKPTCRSTEPERPLVPTLKQFRKILPHRALQGNVRPERAERRARLVTAIARGRRWLDELSSGAVTDAHQLAKRERCTVRQVNLTLSLAFLAPQLVKAALEGRLPRGITLERLRDPHAEWNRQFQELGLDPH